MKNTKLVITVVVVLGIGIFLVRNMQNQARLRLFGEFQVNTLILIGASFFAGVAFLMFFNLWRNTKSRKQAKKNKKVADKERRKPSPDADL